MTKPSFVYVTYIETSAAKVWQAIIDPEVTRQYWPGPHENVSDWQPGSSWAHRRGDVAQTVDVVGKVVESTPPQRLVMTWARPREAETIEKHSRVTFEIEPLGDRVVRLTVIHQDLEQDSDMLKSILNGWPLVLSNLKTFLEAGRPLPRTP